MRFEISLLVETPTTDGAAVRFLSRVDQLVPLQFVGVRELFATHCAVVLHLLFGRLQELGRNVYWNTNHLPARALLTCVGEIKVKLHNSFDVELLRYRKTGATVYTWTH